MFAETCKKIESEVPLSNREIFKEFNLLGGHPWEASVNSDATNYYSCLYKIVNQEKTRRILEIGTAFGLSAASMLKASPDIELLVSVDLGIFGEQSGFSRNNIDFARTRIHQWCCKKHIPLDRVRFYQANSQPDRIGDNENAGVEIRRWHQVPELVRLLTRYEFDVVFVDGKHTEDGLFNDFVTVWPMLREGGLLICDDLHDADTYRDLFPWAGQTLASFQRFVKSHSPEIQESSIWNYPCVTPADYTGLRPFGLIRKKNRTAIASPDKKFEIFDVPEALDINRARQDHLASLGLDLAHKTVLEVGSGVGKHTGFFEKLGCTVQSTDARPENVAEHLRRYPHRKGHVEVADLNITGSHTQFGEFDIVYCYGTLYHLGNPALCLRELSANCRELFLLETCVNSYDNNDINCVPEESQWKNQSFDGTGCRPARDWIVSELKKHYPFVYCTRYQPAHEDFPLKWPANCGEYPNSRIVVVASKVPLGNGSLITEISDMQIKLEPVILSDHMPPENGHFADTIFGRAIEFVREKFHSCKISPVFNPEGENLARLFEAIIYTGGDREQVLVATEDKILFTPTSVKDHLVTPFIPLSACSGENTIHLRITISYFEKNPPSPHCILYLQDSKFNRLSGNFNFARADKKIISGYVNLTEIVTIPFTVGRFRIFIMSEGEKPAVVPYSITIEQLEYSG